MGDDVYEVNNVNTGKNKPTLIEHCPQGCQNGMCRVFSLTTCTNEGQIGMDFITKCSAICKDGRYAIAPWCDKIDVVGYNNLSTYTAYSALSKLPDTLFDGIERTPLVLSWNMALDVDYEKNSYTAGEYFSKESTDLPYDYTQISNRWNEPIDEYVVIHEFIHQWVTQKGRREVSNPSFLEQYPEYELYGELLYEQPGIAYPPDYMKTVGCQWIWVFGSTYDPKYPPVTGYRGREEQNIPCWEDFADSATWYVEKPCELKEKSPGRYDYFRDKMFQGKEYIPEGGCGGN